jgi:hypothetical protein
MNSSKVSRLAKTFSKMMIIFKKISKAVKWKYLLKNQVIQPMKVLVKALSFSKALLLKESLNRAVRKIMKIILFPRFQQDSKCELKMMILRIKPIINLKKDWNQDEITSWSLMDLMKRSLSWLRVLAL